ncbi:hypothetical protein FPCIR_14041 [Fusarium pseudocircinatum]|uniref:F-box domain-containing protein n=1 Tax=Fusarium pseudocircinatum TaxID=56676 RepID=A0A8H5KIB7_9HYPO|nr:hypothetical protein FPCIR_14041 [Fusarium pseudocircinatum]
MNSHSCAQTQSKLCHLPPELLLHILDATGNYSNKVRLFSTCKRLYNLLILSVYSEAGRQLRWLPMFDGAKRGNCHTLARCIEAGAPIDYEDLESPFRPIRPLQTAIGFARPLTVKWLLNHGANPNSTRDPDTASFSCPLAQALRSILEPGLPFQSVPYQMELRYCKVPGRKHYVRNNREIIKALRQAGADEQPLGYLGRSHLDAIEAGVHWCSHH